MVSSFNNESGMTLLEILIAVVITTIVMAASYVTYNLVSKQYSSLTDRAGMRHAGRKAMDIIIKDLRNAGYSHEDSTCPAIIRPIYSYDGGNSKEDKLEIIYDVSSKDQDKLIIERRKIIYEVNNNQLYKEVSNDTVATCNPSSKILYSDLEDQLLIKNVEDLQFEGMKKGDNHNVCGADIINIYLTVKSNKEHGNERKFLLEQNANSELMENISDKYLRETFTTSVLLRNIFYGGTCT